MRITIAVALLLTGAFSWGANQPTEGQIRGSGDWVMAWSQTQERWVPLQAFWWEYAKANERGRHWGEGAEYPAYEEVMEHDTFLEINDEGPCLMYFFHERWRRAQDVRRWDPKQNESLGCPHVF